MCVCVCIVGVPVRSRILSMLFTMNGMDCRTGGFNHQRGMSPRRVNRPVYRSGYFLAVSSCIEVKWLDSPLWFPGLKHDQFRMVYQIVKSNSCRFTKCVSDAIDFIERVPGTSYERATVFLEWLPLPHQVISPCFMWLCERSLPE